MPFDTLLSCLDGHLVTDALEDEPETKVPFCKDCGKPTISQCPNCNERIQGARFDSEEGRLNRLVLPPGNCSNCGKAFPWTERAEAAAKERRQLAAKRSTEDILLTLFDRFHSVQNQLRSRYGDRPTLEVADEYDVQNLLHALLKIFFDDIRPEEQTPSYGANSSRMDFLLKKEQLVIETKMTRKSTTTGKPSLGPKEVVSQLSDDIHRYQVHPDCKRLVCFVYDPLGLIPNPDGIEGDLSKKHDNGFDVTVYVRPKQR